MVLVVDTALGAGLWSVGVFRDVTAGCGLKILQLLLPGVHNFWSYIV